MSRSPFSRIARSGGAVKANLDPEEREVLAHLCDELAGLLSPAPPAGSAGPSSTPAAAGRELDDVEAALFAQLDGLGSEAVDPPSDPILARLLPDAVKDDAEASAEFRRLTETDLRRSKVRCLQVAAAAMRREGERVRLDAEEAGCLLKALNDVRLALGEMLGLHSDADADLMAAALDAADRAQSAGRDLDALGLDEGWVVRARLYEGLGYWQSALIDALDA